MSDEETAVNLPFSETVEDVPEIEWEDRDDEGSFEPIEDDEPISFEEAVANRRLHNEDDYETISHPDAEDPDSMTAPTSGFDNAVDSCDDL